MGATFDAVVVGSGPNGLGCAIELARAGKRVKLLEGQPTFGGGARSAALTLPGFTHDLCSAIHPLAASSPFFQSMPLEKFGLTWLHPESQLAHPLDDGTAAVLERSVEETAATLGPDGETWIKLMKPFVDRWDDFKNALFRQPGTLHVHFFGTATLSFSDSVRTQAGDEFEIEADAFRLGLRNRLEADMSVPPATVRTL